MNDIARQREILKNKRDLYIRELETCNDDLHEKVLLRYKTVVENKISDIDKVEEEVCKLVQERESEILKILYQLEEFLENNNTVSYNREIINNIISNSVEFSIFESLCDFLNSIVMDKNIKVYNGLITYISIKPYLKKCFTLEKEFIFKSDIQFEGYNIYIYLSNSGIFKCDIDKRIINKDIYYSMTTLPIDEEEEYTSPIETSVNPPEVDKIIDDKYEKIQSKPTEEYGFIRRFIKKIFKL